MILYLDTSAVLKIYLQESESDRVRNAIAEAGAVCTHLITYAEMRAGLDRAVRTRRLSDADRVREIARFEEDWQSLAVVAVDEPLVRRAGELAERFGLRGYDCVHLAAAERVSRELRSNFRMAAYDRHLIDSGRALGMAILGDE